MPLPSSVAETSTPFGEGVVNARKRNAAFRSADFRAFPAMVPASRRARCPRAGTKPSEKPLDTPMNELEGFLLRLLHAK